MTSITTGKAELASYLVACSIFCVIFSYKFLGYEYDVICKYVVQELEKTAVSNVESEEPGSASSSTSSGVNQTSRKGSPIFSLSPIKSSNQKVSPKNVKNLPPLPKSKARVANYDEDSSMYRSNLINRSLSTREFRKSNQREQLELYAVDD